MLCCLFTTLYAPSSNLAKLIFAFNPFMVMKCDCDGDDGGIGSKLLWFLGIGCGASVVIGIIFLIPCCQAQVHLSFK